MKLAMLAAVFLANALGQVVITDTGSTNRAGMSVTIGEKGAATVEGNRGAKAKMNLSSDLHARLMKDLEAAGPMDQIHARRCIKSVSFGSSTFITYKGVRSPDLSCPGQSDPTVEALQTDVKEIMAEARTKMPAEPRFR